MNIYYLILNDVPKVGQFYTMVVVATNEEDARCTAYSRGTNTAWLLPTKSTCTNIGICNDMLHHSSILAAELF